jgi:hypothetical protein
MENIDMAHQQADTKTLLLSVIEEYSHSDIDLEPQVRSISQDDPLLIMAHAHLHAAMSLMRKAGLKPQDIAEDLYPRRQPGRASSLVEPR